MKKDLTEETGGMPSTSFTELREAWCEFNSSSCFIWLLHDKKVKDLVVDKDSEKRTLSELIIALNGLLVKVNEARTQVTESTPEQP